MTLTLAVVGIYLLLGAVVLAWQSRRPRDDEGTLEVEQILARLEYPDGPPVSFRLANLLGTGLALVVGLIIWPITLKSHTTPAPTRIAPNPRIVRQPDQPPSDR